MYESSSPSYTTAPCSARVIITSLGPPAKDLFCCGGRVNSGIDARENLAFQLVGLHDIEQAYNLFDARGFGVLNLAVGGGASEPPGGRA